MRAGHRIDDEPWVMVAIAKDDAIAEDWQRLIEDHGIAAEVRTDAPELAGLPRGGPFGYVEPGRSLYSYPVYVRASDRAEARRILGEDGGIGEGVRLDRGMLLGALAVVGGSLLLVALLALRT